MLSWLKELFDRYIYRYEPPPPQPGPKRPRSATAFFVSHDEHMISVRRPDGTDQAIAWNDLGAVNVLTTDAGPFEVDLFWVLSDRDGHRGPVVPMGADGEHEFLQAMQARLHGFDNMAVVEAMGSTSMSSFLVWDHARRETAG
jgi:hypothetical protein